MSKMTSIYAWTGEDPEFGEGVIFTWIPLLGMAGCLQHRRREIAEKFRPIAQNHAARTGHKVRFVRFDRAEELE